MPVGNVPKSHRLFTYRIVTSSEEKPSQLTKLCIRLNLLSLAVVEGVNIE